MAETMFSAAGGTLAEQCAAMRKRLDREEAKGKELVEAMHKSAQRCKDSIEEMLKDIPDMFKAHFREILFDTSGVKEMNARVEKATLEHEKMIARNQGKLAIVELLGKSLDAAEERALATQGQ